MFLNTEKHNGDASLENMLLFLPYQNARHQHSFAAFIMRCFHPLVNFRLARTVFRPSSACPLLFLVYCRNLNLWPTWRRLVIATPPGKMPQHRWDLRMVGAQSRPGSMREREISCPYLALNHDCWLSIPWPSYTDNRKQRRSKLGFLDCVTQKMESSKLLRNVDPGHSVFGGINVFQE